MAWQALPKVVEVTVEMPTPKQFTLDPNLTGGYSHNIDFTLSSMVTFEDAATAAASRELAATA